MFLFLVAPAQKSKWALYVGIYSRGRRDLLLFGGRREKARALVLTAWYVSLFPRQALRRPITALVFKKNTVPTRLLPMRTLNRMMYDVTETGALKDNDVW